MITIMLTLFSIAHCDNCELLCGLSCSFLTDCYYAEVDGFPVGCECKLNNTRLGELIGGVVGGLILLCLLCCYCCKSNNVTVVQFKEKFITKEKGNYQSMQ